MPSQVGGDSLISFAALRIRACQAPARILLFSVFLVKQKLLEAQPSTGTSKKFIFLTKNGLSVTQEG